MRCSTIILLLLAFSTWPADGRQIADEGRQVVDTFESDEIGGLPARWQSLHDKEFIPLTPDLMHPNERFFIVEENGNKALRVFSRGESVSIMLGNGRGMEWRLSEQPIMAWDWKAIRLPEGAREDRERLNDSGAAIYVIFKMEGFLIRRPKSIKYVYSSTLQPGTTVRYGKLGVIVVSSALDGTGEWVHVERNVVEDYRKVFREEPPDRPLYLRLWSDSDNTDSPAEADFDNIVLQAVPDS